MAALGTREAMADPGTREAMADPGLWRPWRIRLILGGAREALSWTEPVEAKVSRTGPDKA